MNRDLLKKLEIDENLGLKEIVSALEAKQYEYLERLQGTADPTRQTELEQILSEIDTEIMMTKEEIQSAGTSLIFDDGRPEPAESPAPAEPEPQPDMLEEKIESLRQMEEERAAAEEQARQDSQTAAQSAAAEAEHNQQISNLATATAAFQRHDYAAAFQAFSPLAEQNEQNAQHFLSMMYHDGLGMPADWEGFDFWSKKAVENGNHIAMEYRANMLLRDGNGKGDHTGKAAKQCYLEALDLLERAGGPDNIAPLETYVSIVELRADKSIDPKLTAMRSCIKSEHVKKAQEFCQIISENIGDSYKAKQWLDRKEAIRKNKLYKIQGAVDAQTAAAQAQQRNYKQYRPKKRMSCGCWILIIIALGLVLQLVPGMIEYVRKAKGLLQDSTVEELLEGSVAEIPYGTQEVALSQVPADYLGESVQITPPAEAHDYMVGDQLWAKPMVFRAGNGSDTAYADYIPDGKFSTLELEAAPMPDPENFMQSTHVAVRVFDLDTTDLLSETIIGSDPVATPVSVDITGRRAIRVAVSLVDGGDGFANLGYTLIRNALLIPAENADAPAEEVPVEEAPAEEPVY